MQSINHGFAEYYSLTEEGQVINTKRNRILKPNNGYSYKLNTTDGNTKTINLKDLYKLVYNKVFCKDDIENLPQEEWKEIEGTEGKYLISSCGRCKSYVGYEAIILQPTTTPKGYYRLQIKQEGQVINKFIHRLVAAAFLPTPAQIDYVLHHIDNQKTNNNKNNLVWLSVQQHNKIHAEQRKQEEQEQAT